MMPGITSSTNLTNCIADSLKKSITHSKSDAHSKAVKNTVASSAKRALLEKAEIKFVKSSKDVNSMLDDLKNKYVCLNKGASKMQNGSSNEIHEGKSVKVKQKDDGIPTPKVTLYPTDAVSCSWESPRRVGAGLCNLGNTCFLNSVLQCLTYTPPLANHFVSGKHKKLCKCSGFCMLCELQTNCLKSLGQPGGAVKPLGILQKLRLIAKHMRWGRQEDAHEFLRYVVDAMQKSCLAGVPNNMEKLSKETTLVHQIFGGYLRSQVRCLQCKTNSNTYDPLLDISIDLKGVNDIEKALQKFVQAEFLDIDNAYKCVKCKKKVRASKQFTIHRPPKILTLHLKRFDYHRLMGGKVSRHVQFPTKLNLRPYMSQRQAEPLNYQLYGALVHSGYSCNSGHYYCYVKAPNGTWYCMNDAHVSQTGVNNVLSSEAYILFYVQEQANNVKHMKAHVNGTTANLTQQSMLNGSHNTASSNGINGHSDHNQKSNNGPKPTLLKTPMLKKLKDSKHETSQSALNPGVRPANSLSTLNQLISDEMQSKNTDKTASVNMVTAVAGVHNSNRATLMNGSISPHNHESEHSDKENQPKKHLVNSEKKASKHKINGDAAGTTLPSKQARLDSQHSVKAAGSKHLHLTSINNKNNNRDDKLMSPPPVRKAPSPSKQDSETNKVNGASHLVNGFNSTSSKWKISSVNGKLRHSSESESGHSVASTSEWQVTTCNEQTNLTPSNAHSAGCVTENKKRKNSVSNSSTTSEDPIQRKKLKTSPPDDISNHDAARMSDENPAGPCVKKKKKKKKKKLSLEAPQEVKQDSEEANLVHAVAVEESSSNHVEVNGEKKQKKKNKKKSKLACEGEQGTSDSALATDETNGGASYCSSSAEKKKKKMKKNPATNKEGKSIKQAGVKMIGSVTAEPVLTDQLTVTKKKKKKKNRLLAAAEPLVKVWDAKFDDTANRVQSTPQAPVSVWDGRRDSNISFIMEKHHNIKGLGTGVTTWDGNKPEINRQIEVDAMMSSYKSGWYDDYEQDIDQGRQKKVKKKKIMNGTTTNHFQSIQDSSNVVRQLQKEGKLASLD